MLTSFFAVLILSQLSGCAAQRVFNNGKELVQQDKVEQGLDQIRAAGKLDPHSVEYKASYFQERDAAVARYLEQADRFIVAGNLWEAENLFRRVLGMDTGNIRAQDGLRHIEMETHHQKLLVEADQLLDSGAVDAAKEKVSVVLTENPADQRALQLQRAIAAKNTRSAADAALAALYKKPITLQFKDVSIKQVFEIISRTSGLNFLFDKEVKTDQKTSVFLKNSTIEAAVYYILLTNQLEQQVMDSNTILIYPNTVAKQKDYQEMMVKSFFLTNADAKVVAGTLKAIIKARDVVVDEKLNMIIMRDTADAIRLAEKLIALHDVAEPEVMLEVEVLEVKRTKLQDLGVQWPNNLTLTPLSTLTTGGLALSDLKHITAQNTAVGSPSAIINAHTTDTDANLLANPRIRARNHEKAKIMIGDRVPNITVNTVASATSFISETINYVDVGLKLEVEPTVYLDNDVAIKISLEVSNIVSQLTTKSGSVAYQIGTRNATTVLRLKDGETQVLAGLINDEDRRTGNKVPALGDLPILGRLFGSTNDDIQKTEIILSITPHLIRNIQRPDVTTAQFNAGTESNLKPRPDSGLPAIPVQRVQPVRTIPAVSSLPSVSPGSFAPADSGNSVPASGSATAVFPVPGGAEVVAHGGADTVPGSADAAPASEPVPAPAEAPQASLVQLKWNGPGVARVGANFTLKLTAQADETLSALPVVVSFDSNVFQVMNVTEGDFLKQGGAGSDFSSQVDTKGQILISGSSSGGSGAQSGTLASIQFRALTETAGSAIDIVSSVPVAASGAALTVNSVGTRVNVGK